MATGTVPEREHALATRAIGYGLSLLRILGDERARYVLQSESDMSIDQVDEFLSMIEGGCSMSTDAISRAALHPEHRRAIEREQADRQSNDDTAQELRQALYSIGAVAGVLADDPEPGIDRDALLGVIVREARRAETLVGMLAGAGQPHRLNLYDPQTGKPTLNNPGRPTWDGLVARARAAIGEYREHCDARGAAADDAELAEAIAGEFVEFAEDEPEGDGERP